MKNTLKILLFALFASFVVYLLKFSPYSRYFFEYAGRQELQQKFFEARNTFGPWAAVVFVGMYAFSIMLFIPASVFNTVGAVVFGKWYGLFLNIIGANVGGVLSFYTARYLLRDMVSRFLKTKHFKSFDDRMGTHGFSVILYMRLMFIPFTYLSFAVGMSKVRFKDFFWGTLLGILPGIFVVTFLADAVKTFISKGMKPEHLLNFEIIMPLGLFVFSFFIPPLVKHFRKKFFVTAALEEEAKEFEK